MTTTALAATRMARRLTVPFQRGADTLDLRLVRATSSQATIEEYAFADHIARFDAQPQPRYVLATTRDITAGISVTISYQEPGEPSVDTRMDVPAGTVAGTSFLLDQPVSATARLTLLTMGTAPFDNNPDQCWTLTALLGNTAKLLWTLGAERDQLRRHAALTVAQRHLPAAIGLSLDLIGADLGVPRFPPLPYGFDSDTVALYHLDDVAGATTPAADATAAYPGRTGHPGVLSGPVQNGLPGRYGLAMGFPAANAAITVQTDATFDIGESDGATIECFVRPDLAATDGPVLSRRHGGKGPGWVLAVGDFGRGIARNVRFTISDGENKRELYADLSLPTDAFSHLAAVLSRLTGRLELYVDGQLRDWLFHFPLGAIARAADLRMGAADGGFRGVLDEVRISSVARTGFGPALGEDDEHYRRRLELFRRWTLPTPANLTTILNRVAGAIGGQPDALVVDDTNATLVRGTRLVHIRPVALLPGENIDATGRRKVAEQTVVGTAEAEDTFDPDYLFRYERPAVDFTPAPIRDLRAAERAADPHLLQIGLVERLDRLVALAGAETTTPGRLLIDSAFDPRSADLRVTGRAVLVGHSSVPPGRLAALAHRAGFDFVAYRTGSGPARVYAAIAPADYFTVETGLAGGGPIDLNLGDTVNLSLRPSPPPDVFLRWFVVSEGGTTTLTPASGAGSRQRTASLLATAPGRLTVKVDVLRGRYTVPVTRELRIGLADLPDGGTITADGSLGADPSVVDRPGTFFDPVFLASHDDPRADYATASAHVMQPAVAEMLDALLGELDRRGTGGRLAVQAAFDPDGDLSAAEGRLLVLRHSTLAPGALAGAAFAAGFAHVRHRGDDVEVRQAPGQLVAVRGPAPGAVIELDEGTTLELTATPSPGDVAAAGLAGQAPGEGPRLGWASGTFDTARITIGSSTRPTVRLRADAAGMAWVQASYLVGDRPVPYTFQVRLRPELDTDATVITKDQHDLIMNILNVLHPVGVEVNTAAIRTHVVELQGGLREANPDYTYPKFRVRGPLPRQVRGPIRG